MKKRVLPESNYQAIYLNGKTLRMPLDSKRPVTELAYPEFWDVKLTNYCTGGCSYCYQDSDSDQDHYLNVPDKIEAFFGEMDENQRPFQVALGGGEPTSHPEFAQICIAFQKLGIDVNYTTNGINMPHYITITKAHCQAVAVTCHSHLNYYWSNAIELLREHEIFTNLHILLWDMESVAQFEEIYREYHGEVKYFVLLPMIKQGRSREGFSAWNTLREFLDTLNSQKDIAFGAMMYKYLRHVSKKWNISLYEPEMMSKYLVMDDDMKVYPSSFNLQEVA